MTIQNNDWKEEVELYWNWIHEQFDDYNKLEMNDNKTHKESLIYSALHIVRFGGENLDPINPYKDFIDKTYTLYKMYKKETRPNRIDNILKEL